MDSNNSRSTWWWCRWCHQLWPTWSRLLVFIVWLLGASWKRSVHVAVEGAWYICFLWNSIRVKGMYSTCAEPRYYVRIGHCICPGFLQESTKCGTWNKTAWEGAHQVVTSLSIGGFEGSIHTPVTRLQPVWGVCRQLHNVNITFDSNTAVKWHSAESTSGSSLLMGVCHHQQQQHGAVFCGRLSA